MRAEESWHTVVEERQRVAIAIEKPFILLVHVVVRPARAKFGVPVDFRAYDVDGLV